MSTKKIDTLDPMFHVVVDDVRLAAMQATGYEWAVVSATRTMKEQHGLFIQQSDGVDNDGDGYIDESDEHVTNADSGDSPHNFKLACDCAPLLEDGEIWWTAPKEIWAIYGKIAESRGLTWGGNFKKLYDAPHIEDPRWRDLRVEYKAGRLEIA
jgi:peptidoglycan L-alanyl-D-glutamate endopeptidase CwlK